MSKILFICHGNVGRSQIAEAYYNHYTNSNDALSGGTDIYSPYVYKVPTDLIKKVMKEEDISLEGKKVKYATREMLRKTQEIYVLCKREVLSDEVLDAERWQGKKLNFWNIEDPYNMDLEGTRKIRDEIKEKVLSIL
jgi:arsenate reductase (thioredoxin)